MGENLKSNIEAFLAAGKAYFEYAQLEALTNHSMAQQGEEASTVSADTVERLMHYQHEQYGERNKLTSIGKLIAQLLVAKKEDAKPLLRFLHAIDGGGGPSEARKYWLELKVFLQELSFELATPPTGAPDALVSRKELAHRLCAALSLTHTAALNRIRRASLPEAAPGVYLESVAAAFLDRQKPPRERGEAVEYDPYQV